MSDEKRAPEDLLRELSTVQQQVSKLRNLRSQHEESMGSLRQYCDTLAKLVSEWAGELGDANRQIREENAARKLVEDELTRTHNFFMGILNALDDPIFVKDDQHRWVFLNDKACEMMGRSRDELIGKSDYDIFPREQADVFWEKDRETLQQGKTVENEEKITWQGKTFTVCTKKSVFADPASGLKYLAGSIHDLTPLKETQEELADVRSQLEGIVDKRTDEVTRLRLMVQQHEIERERAEHQLQQAQRLEAVGRLAAGLAHDFNNLLTGIVGGAEMLLYKAEKDDPSRSWLEEIRRAGHRAGKLTGQLLTLSRQQMLEVKVINLNEVVVNAEWVIRRIIGETIDCEVLLDPSLGRVFVDASQMEQVVVNLAVNAKDAMADGGHLLIKTYDVHVDRDNVKEHPGVCFGDNVCLMVRDAGHGMDEETLARIFEPFFTTKEEGKGTGLGLSTVHSIINEHNGAVLVDSAEGEGTTFRIYLPRVDAESERLGSVIL